MPDFSDIYAVLKGLYTRFNNFKKRFGPYKPFETIAEKMEMSIALVELLSDYYSEHLPSKKYDKLNVTKQSELTKLNDLVRGFELSEDETFAFQDDLISQVYSKRIVKVKKFVFHRHSKLIYDLRSTSTLYYDIILPFNVGSYDPTSTNCTSKHFLPFFFFTEKSELTTKSTSV